MLHIRGYKSDLKKAETLEENKDYYLKIAANSLSAAV